MTTKHARVNGLEMRYEDRGEGPPLLLLHGFTGAAVDWGHALELDALAARWRVIVPDLRGHGGTRNDVWPLTHRRCAEDLLALLDAIGVGTFRAIGLSFGGNVMLHAATMQPERVEAMVIVSATPRFPDQARPILRAFATAPRSEEEWRVMRERHEHDDDRIRALWRTPADFAESHDDLCFTREALARIAARTLIVQGDRDPLYPVSLSVEMLEAIPRAALWIRPEAGHGAIFGEDRPEFEARALAFLAR
ncbi:alpha/beta fold hydrolase [Sandaracinus amylolyticus]|uniref:Putative hydrolase/acyltransferase n=1 Tax=Sandaracinus amylolyticus TaxID=927083 RepID=A0A0F6SHR2_9BACT|nr:alpha/beta hydrolase [Sandaracinus amylolyticus]AKF10889.1 putative hydrolase/acyltransferase [Sandaracinus amylolyticus]